jgi:hypothetical protein
MFGKIFTYIELYNSHVTLLTPPSVPAVSDDPKIDSVFNSIANKSHRVLATLPIAIITLLGFIKDTSFIKLEFITKNRHLND